MVDVDDGGISSSGYEGGAGVRSSHCTQGEWKHEDKEPMEYCSRKNQKNGVDIEMRMPWRVISHSGGDPGWRSNTSGRERFGLVITWGGHHAHD